MSRKKKNKYLEAPLTEEEKLDRNIKRKPILIKKLKHDAVIKVVVFFVAFFITFTFIFGVTRAGTNDMYPAIHDGDVIMYFRLGDFMNGDVVVYETKDGMNVGRVQACMGSVIGQTEGGKITIDGNFQPIQKSAGLYYETYVRDGLELPCQVGKDQYLVLGDEREQSKDSRDYGLINKEDIKGKVFTFMRRRPL